MFFFETLLRRIPAVLSAAVLLALVALAALGVRSWLASRDVAVRLAATVAAQQKLLDQAAVRQRRRNATLQKALAEIARAKKSVETPSEAALKIPQLLPVLPHPVRIRLPKPKPGAAPPAATAQVPQADLKPIYDYLQDCRACRLKLRAAQADLHDERTKVTALTSERDAAIRASRGGGFWSHVTHAAKWFLIGGAVGALAAAAAHR